MIHHYRFKVWIVFFLIVFGKTFVCIAQSPLLDIIDNVSSLLTQKEEAETILLDKELLKLLNDTPRAEQNVASKQFIPRNSSRNITNSFTEVEAAPVFTPMDSEFKHD